MNSTYTLQKIIRINFTWFLRVFWPWFFQFVHLAVLWTKWDTVYVCSTLERINSLLTDFKDKYVTFFSKIPRDVELSWSRSVVFLKLILPSLLSQNCTSLENNFAHYTLVPFSISKPNLFNSIHKWLTFPGKSTMSLTIF